MAILQDNEELLEAALGEIKKLPSDQRSVQDPTGELQYLLAAHRRLQGDKLGEDGVYAHALHADPSSQKAKLALLQNLHEVNAASDIGAKTSYDLRSTTMHQIHERPWGADAAMWAELQ